VIDDELGQILKTWQQFFEIQDGDDRHLEFFETMYFQHHRNDLNRSPNVFTNFGEDRSNSKQMAAVSKSKMAAAAILNCGYLDF